MRNVILTVFFLAVLIMTFTSLGMMQGTPTEQVEEVKIFSETFGDSTKQTILLNAGAGMQAIEWPSEFCQKLADKGYFVIRYDYRDTGLSSAIDFEKTPYSVMSLVYDTHTVLDKYSVVKAHYVGFSMGGQLAQLAGGFHPRRVKSVVLLGTSTDFRPGFDAFEGKYSDKGLSPPNKEYVEWATRKVPENQTEEERLAAYIKTWRMLDGSPANFDEEFFRKQAVETFSRTKLQQPYVNHSKAMKFSFESHELAPGLIKLPTLIIQGQDDPVFPPDHGKDLNQKIAGSKLVVWDNFAHAISPRNFDRLIDEMDKFFKSIK